MYEMGHVFQSVLDEVGCDSLRLCILSGAAPKSDRKWDREGQSLLQCSTFGKIALTSWYSDS